MYCRDHCLGLSLVLFLSCLPAFTYGHGYVAFVTVDDTTFKENAPNAQPTPAATRQINDVGPVKGASNAQLTCGHTPNPATQFADQMLKVNPGSRVAFDWRGGDLSKWPHNTGPMLTYMADCGQGGCEKFDATKAKWFKIQQIGRKTGGNKEWAQQDLMNGGTAIVTIPSNIAPGNYLIRHEIIALHLAVTEGGAEFYPSCTQIAISGNGSGRPKSQDLVSFPGAYKDDDPGIFFRETFNTSATYIFPGPAIASFVSPSSDSPSTSGSTSTPPRSLQGSCGLKKRSSPTKMNVVMRPRHVSRIMKSLSFGSLSWH
ncbi:hypothetical protein BDN71DRAFT_1439291 [Pleurotus eryngii]|uniref:lytic cellulose monooxygenase (C4-dehydrogenating) n=1 Tax=Pleurotus eryngii TaxID=5323 RepID=A0A9P6A7L6_PLEER|nr:hypothetical protein BDN71DRAFT_1439291 [Pleurotus eryngii]